MSLPVVEPVFGEALYPILLWRLDVAVENVSAGLAKGFRGSATKDEPTILPKPFVLEVPLPFTILSTGSFFGDAETNWDWLGDVTAWQGAPCRGVCVLIF